MGRQPWVSEGIAWNGESEVMMRKWLVVTPVYTDWTYDPYEPPETGCDVVEVEAATKREAKILGVRELRRTRSHWLKAQQSDNASPFTGLRVDCAHPGCNDVEETDWPTWSCPQCGERVFEDSFIDPFEAIPNVLS